MASQPITLRVPGVGEPLRMRLHGAHDRFVSERLREEGIWEPYETSLLRRLLRPGGIFLDVGANIGYFTLLAAHWVGPAGGVFAVEPDPANFALLRDNLTLNSLLERVVLLNAGMAERDGETRLYLSEDNLGDHQLHPDEPGRRSIAVPLVNATAWLEGRCAQLDVIKVDTQGAEHAVLSGLLPFLLKQQSPFHLLIELTPFSLRAAGTHGRALIELLEGLALPFWIVDHIEHRLVATEAEDLARWCDNVDDCEGDRGFMNILVGPAIPEGRA
ncbi:MAG: FkbM family methyltransferase [Pseudomonadota bacterium]